MAANVRFIIGRAGSGKTHAVFEGVAKNERNGKRSLLIVPDRATFETERELSSFLGGGIMFASVLSFTRLARRLLAEAGVRTRFLSSQGRQMLVRRVLDESAAEELSVFSRVGAKRGFAAECDEIILKCKRCSITPEQLSSAEGLPDQLRDKLAVFALIYDRTVKRMEKEYVDGEDLVNRLIDLLPSSSVRGADVFIDAPDMMNAQSFRIIESLFACAASVTLTFRVDPDPSADRFLFEPDRLSYERLSGIAAACGCAVTTLKLRGNRRQSGALAFLERNLFAYPFQKTDMAAGNIELHSSIDKLREVREAAERIIRAVGEDGSLRFRDIAVVVGDLPEYACAIRRCFGEYGIPLFMDAGRSVSAHPVSELIIGALRTVSGGFRAEDYIRVLKSGLSGIDDAAVERLENHILRFGLNGKRLSSAEPSVKNHDDIKDFEELEASRRAVSEKLNAFHDELMASRSATERAAAVYDYLLSVGAPEAIRKSCEELAKSPDMRRYADESAQAFDTVISLLDQLHIILGDEAVGLERFLSVIEEGLAAYEINVIPTLLDQVLVGDAGSVHLGKTRMLLVLGANEGVLPRRRDDNSIINDRELMLMRAAGLDAWDSSESMNKAEDLRLYSLLSKPTEALYVSRCVKRGEQNAAPAAVVSRIAAVFESCLRTENGEGPAGAGAAAFSDLAAGLRSFVDTGEAEPSLAPLYAHFTQAEGDEALQRSLKTLEGLYFANKAKRNIGPDAARSLYGESVAGSPTRLETFNRCPFCYLMQYGLSLKERELREERAVDHGKLVHRALELILQPMIAQQADFGTITKEQLAAQLDEFLPALFEEHNHGFLGETALNRAERERLRGEILGLAFVIVRQLASGTFRPFRTECEFGKPKAPLKALEITSDRGFTFRIIGVVDRVDTLATGSGSYFRIVDYKTGDVKFKYSELASGLKLQLPLYAAAMQEGFPEEEGFRPSGFYYMHVVDLDVVTGDAETDEAALIGKLSLSGPSVLDGEVLIANGEFRKSGYSLVIRGLQLNKSGAFTSRSDLLIGSEEMADTIEFAKRKAGETLDAIMSGRADVSPSKLDHAAACKYCPSRSICGFDTTSGSRYRRIRPVTPGVFYEELAKEKKNREKKQNKEDQ